MSNLDQFTDRGSDAPIVRRGEPILHRHHETNQRTVVGHLAQSNYGPAYMTERELTEHLYGQYNADPESWAISDDVLARLEHHDVDVFFVFDTEARKCYVYGDYMFMDEDYPHSFSINFEDGDRQTAVPTGMAIIWDAEDVSLML